MKVSNGLSRVVALTFGILLVASACSSSGSNESTSTTDGPAAEGQFVDEGAPVDGGSVTWGLEAETDGLNPISGRFAMSGHMMASAIFDPLATIDEDGNAVPYLAEALTPNDDFTVWTITLRPDVLFHDGTPMTAEVVADTYQLHKDSAITSRAVADIETIEVTGPLEVTMTMSVPWATFPYVLTTQAGYIPAPSMLETPEQARTPVGTGPFRFQSWDYGTSFKASKFADYWQPGKPHLDAIEFRPIPDAQQRRDDLLNGNIDAMNTFRTDDIAEIESTPGFKVLAYDEGEERFIMLNSGVAPFDSKTARQAVAYATDSARVRDEVFGVDSVVPADDIWAPGQLGHRDESNYPEYDLERAKDLVQQYKTETGQDLAFTLTAADDIDTQRLQQVVLEMWRAAGMQVELETVSQADLVVVGALGTYQAADWRNFGQPDPDGEFVWLHSRNIDAGFISLNFAQFADPGVDAALERGHGTLDPTVRDEAYAEVSRILNENTPYIWMYRVTWAIASTDEVNGYGAAANGSLQTVGTKTWVADLWRS
jgi:peptide/nickel transport system substrate-binding protein